MPFLLLHGALLPPRCMLRWSGCERGNQKTRT